MPPPKSMLRRNRLADLAFDRNTSKDFGMTLTRKLRRIIFSFVGVLTIAGGTTDGALAEDGVLLTLFKKLELIADGKTIIDTDGRATFWRRAVISGSSGVLVEPGATVGAHSVRAHVELDMDQIATAAKFAGRINNDLLNSLLLRVTMGNEDGEIIAGGDRTETLVGDTEIVSEYHDDEWNGGHRRISRHRLTIPGASADERLVLPTGNVVSDITFIAVDNGVRDNDIVNRIKVQIGEDNVSRDVTWDQLQGENVEDYGLELVAGAPPYVGVAVMTFDKDGDMSADKLLDLRNLKQQAATIRFDVNAPTGVSYVDAIVNQVASASKP